MSEIERKVSIHIRPTDPPYDGVRRFMACLDRNAHPDNFEYGLCELMSALPIGKWYESWFPVDVGAHYVSLGVYLAEVEEYTIDVFIQAFDGINATPLYYVTTYTIGLDTPRSLSFRIGEDFPYIEGLVLTPQEEIVERKQEVIELSTNDPNTLTSIKSIEAVGRYLYNGLVDLSGSLSNIKDLGSSITTGFFSSLFGNMSEMFKRTAQESIATSLEAVDVVVSESPEWKKEIDSKLTNYTQKLVGDVMKELSPEAIGKSPLTPEEAQVRLTIAGLGGLGLHTTAFIGGIIAEAMTLGQLDGLTRISEEVLNNLGLGDLTKAMIMTPLEPLLLTPAKYYWQKEFVPLIPPYTDLINMRVKEKITQAQFVLNMQYQGYKEEWSGLIWDAHFLAPNFGDIRRAYYRGEWTNEQKLDIMKRVDLDPYYNETVWETLMYEIPPVSELVNERVKEVIGDKDFAKGLKFHGYTPEWALRIWNAHFMPPTLGDIMTAYRRGIPVTIPSIDEETGQPTTRTVTSLALDDVHELMKLVDLDPRYNTLFDTRLYRDPSLRETRYMFETGAIDESGVKGLVVRTGLDPVYVDEMTHYLTHFTERTYQRRYLTALATAYMNNTYTEIQVKDLVGKAGFTEGVGDWIVMIGGVRRDIKATPQERLKPRILTMSQLDKAYVKDVIDESEYTTRMLQLNYETLDIALKVQILDLDKHIEEEGRKVIRLTTAQLINAWKQDVMSEDEVRTELQLRGLDTMNVERLINTKKKQWGRNGNEEA